ncbi:MAG: CRISPR-associated helicase Cas3' [Clostridiales bacterium]|nr:CRISPR-associated helicase Cas3' [Clostridiales bacterium]
MKEYEKFAAHVREENGNVQIQAVKEHCQETAEFCKKYGNSTGTGYIAYIAALLHDMGKFTQKFDDYVRGNKSYRRGEIDHSYAGARYIIEFSNTLGAEFYDVSHFIARIIVSHHGLHDWVLTDGTDYLTRRTGKDENYEVAKSHVQEIISEDLLREYIGFANKEYHEMRGKLKAISMRKRTAFAFYMGMFERVVQSMLIDADRTNTSEFMMNRKIELDYDRKKLFEYFHDNYEAYMKRKAETFALQNERIVRQRNDISNRCRDFARHEAGICQLIVPTGGGKTLSSLRYAIEYGIGHEAERIIYVAPFMSILDQNSDVFKEIVGEENFLEHHSNVVQEIDNEEELAEYELYAARWDKPVIATTMVQFLNTLFLGKTSSVRRMHRFSRAVIIVDEVQSLPLKCVNLFYLAMNFLKEMCKSVIVLCSATQPDFTKSDYPILMDEDSQMIGDYREDFAVFKRTQIIPEIGTCAYTYDQAAEFCKNVFEKNRNLLVIVNTKKSVVEMRERLQKLISQDDMQEDVSIVCLSTNLCPQHRRDKLDFLKESLIQKEKVICITTPLIEAGVDISFASVVRFLSGLDNLAQAAGRCNRNGEHDGTAPVYVLKVDDENLGNLTQIKHAQQNTMRFLMKKDVENNYLSVEVMRQYFSLLYAEEKDQLTYNVKDGSVSTTLLNLLSENVLRWNLNGNKHLRYSAQAFQTAGELFEVIDSDTLDVIVPYNKEAKNLMEELESESNMGKVNDILRKAQKYTVTVYRGMLRKMEDEGALLLYECGAVGLRHNYYDSELGVNLKESMHELLMF